MAKPEDDTLIHARLKTPKSAALAGIVFSLLMFTIFGLLRRSIPADPLEPGAWLAADTKMIALALNLVPFAGVAFLWFISRKIASLPRCFSAAPYCFWPCCLLQLR
jgi:hypothetical protein